MLELLLLALVADLPENTDYFCFSDPRIKLYYPTPACGGRIPIVDHDRVALCDFCTEWQIHDLRKQGIYAFIPMEKWTDALVWL